MESTLTLITLFSALILVTVPIDARPISGSTFEVLLEDRSIGESSRQGTTKLDVPNTKNTNCHKKKPFAKDDFEPRPNISAYDDEKLTEKKNDADEFEPRPNISVYDNGVGLKFEKVDADDIKPKETFWIYERKANGLKNEKSDNDEFEPRPNISIYDNGIIVKNTNEKKIGDGDDFEPRPNVSVYDNGVGLNSKKGAGDDFKLGA